MRQDDDETADLTKLDELHCARGVVSVRQRAKGVLFTHDNRDEAVRPSPRTGFWGNEVEEERGA